MTQHATYGLGNRRSIRLSYGTANREAEKSINGFTKELSQRSFIRADANQRVAKSVVRVASSGIRW